jgi:ketosteroid isomerase-like protein
VASSEGSSATERIALVRRGHTAYETGDVEAVGEILDPELIVFAPPDVGNPGTFHGPEGFAQWAGHWNEAWEDFSQELTGVEAIGERHAIADVHQTARGRASGVELEQDASYVYEVRGGRAVYLAIYLDRERAVEDARRREAGV